VVREYGEPADRGLKIREEDSDCDCMACMFRSEDVSRLLVECAEDDASSGCSGRPSAYPTAETPTTVAEAQSYKTWRVSTVLSCSVGGNKELVVCCPINYKRGAAIDTPEGGAEVPRSWKCVQRGIDCSGTRTVGTVFMLPRSSKA